MTTYNTGYPYSNLVASPPVACLPYEIGARVRLAYGYIAATASATPAAGSIINVTKLPVGAFIIAVLTKWADMSADSATIQLRAGTTAISAANDVSSAQAAYGFEYVGSGVVIDADTQIINGLTATGTLGSAITAKLEFVIVYAHD